MKRYNPKDIEPKWQKIWEDNKLYQVQEDSNKPKKYVLEYFPYPSGAAMHVGHVRNYTIGDAISRHARMSGYNVLHPMGWDAFGLPAENYAIKTGISPRQAIDENTARFKQQLIQMGFGYDWSREIDSTDPEYYRWTQWLFLMLYKRGLAYQKDSLQWWCPNDKTVLANEQVEAGKCWRCGHDVVKKSLNQWFFKITDYADRLDKDLEDLNWSHAIKTMQRNWIGRSSGAEIDFEVKAHGEKLRVFTTRPDTLFGATFMVVAPEHPIVSKITSTEQKSVVEKYQKISQAKSDIERQEQSKEKTGVFTGAYAINPANDEQIPIWIADYVLYGYGTGAIMAVPAHDERDNAFAKHFEIPIKQVIAPKIVDVDNPEKPDKKYTDRNVVMCVIKHPTENTYLTLRWKKHKWHNLVMGGVEAGEDIKEAGRREIIEETGYNDLKFIDQMPMQINSRFYAAHKDVNRNILTTVLLFELNSLNQVDTKKEAHEDFEAEWTDTKKLSELQPVSELPYILDWLNGVLPVYVSEGTVINSGKYDGKPSQEVRDNIVEDLQESGNAEEKINYKLRDWLISRQRYWGAPIPIIHCEKDGPVPVPDEQLPVVLPELESYEPTGEGSVLEAATDWVNVDCPICGRPAKRETDTMDGFACSSWYFLRFADPHNQKKAFDPELAKKWLPVDDYIGGAEHAVMHLLYARFWTKVMYDTGLIDFQEPFSTLRNHGMILAPDGLKMSKSKGNTIEPDEIISQGYGADAIRIMELFIGPWNQSANWSVEGMGGCYRFLQRVWTLTHEHIEVRGKEVHEEQSDDLLKLSHTAIKKVSSDMHQLGFNTAIAAQMEFVNDLYKLKNSIPLGTKAWDDGLIILIKLLAPFAPHISEELWADLGQEGSVHTSSWPMHDEKFLVQDQINIVIQVNGKVRANISLPADSTEGQVIEAARSEPKLKEYLQEEVRKTIYVPQKLVNFVV